MKFEKLANLFDRIEPISSRLEIRDIVADYLSTNTQDIDKSIYFLQGRLFLDYEGKELNLGIALLEQAIAKSFGYSLKKVQDKMRELGDIGIIAEYFSSKSKQKSLFSKKLTLVSVFKDLRSIAKIEGSRSQSSKINTLSALLKDAKPTEAKYITKIITKNLRISLGDQTIIDAITLSYLNKQDKEYKYTPSDESFKETKAVLERKYNICGDLGLITKTLFEKGSDKVRDIKVKVGIPIKSALCERESSSENIIKRLGKCIVEAKYDGFRAQIHHKDGVTKIFSRRSEDMTHQFPEIKEILKDFKENIILDSEVMGYDYNSKKFLGFQQTIKRKRKHDINQTQKDIPIQFNVFDVMYYNEETIDFSLKKRRLLVENIIDKIGSKKIVATQSIITDNSKDIDIFFKKVLSENLEGIIAKNLTKPYIPGSRDFAWIKLKKNYLDGKADTIDLSVMGYFLGSGKYANKPSALLCGIYDEYRGKYIAIAKVGSGLNEAQIDKFKSEFKTLSKKPANYISSIEPSGYIKPEHVIEVIYDEITKSPLYKDTKSSLSLRFPRVVRVRDDKGPQDSTKEEEIVRLYKLQTN